MDQKQASPWETIGLGALAAVIGFYLVLAALSLLPAPGGPDTPTWLVLAVGFCYLLGGLRVVIPAIVMDESGMDEGGERPAKRPLHLAQYVFALAVVMAVAMVASAVALGPGLHGSLPLSSSDSLDVLGRAVFAIGAIVIWLGLLRLAMSGWRKRAGGKA
jgi:uncharacterized membrane protein